MDNIIETVLDKNEQSDSGDEITNQELSFLLENKGNVGDEITELLNESENSEIKDTLIGSLDDVIDENYDILKDAIESRNFDEKSKSLIFALQIIGYLKGEKINGREIILDGIYGGQTQKLFEDYQNIRLGRRAMMQKPELNGTIDGKDTNDESDNETKVDELIQSIEGEDPETQTKIERFRELLNKSPDIREFLIKGIDIIIKENIERLNSEVGMTLRNEDILNDLKNTLRELEGSLGENNFFKGDLDIVVRNFLEPNDKGLRIIENGKHFLRNFDSENAIIEFNEANLKLSKQLLLSSFGTIIDIGQTKSREEIVRFMNQIKGLGFYDDIMSSVPEASAKDFETFIMETFPSVIRTIDKQEFIGDIEGFLDGMIDKIQKYDNISENYSSKIERILIESKDGETYNLNNENVEQIISLAENYENEGSEFDLIINEIKEKLIPILENFDGELNNEEIKIINDILNKYREGRLRDGYDVVNGGLQIIGGLVKNEETLKIIIDQLNQYEMIKSNPIFSSLLDIVNTDGIDFKDKHYILNNLLDIGKLITSNGENIDSKITPKLDNIVNRVNEILENVDIGEIKKKISRFFELLVEKLVNNIEQDIDEHPEIIEEIEEKVYGEGFWGGVEQIWDDYVVSSVDAIGDGMSTLGNEIGDYVKGTGIDMLLDNVEDESKRLKLKEILDTYGEYIQELGKGDEQGLEIKGNISYFALLSFLWDNSSEGFEFAKGSVDNVIDAINNGEFDVDSFHEKITGTDSLELKDFNKLNSLLIRGVIGSFIENRTLGDIIDNTDGKLIQELIEIGQIRISDTIRTNTENLDLRIGISSNYEGLGKIIEGLDRYVGEERTKDFVVNFVMSLKELLQKNLDGGNIKKEDIIELTFSNIENFIKGNEDIIYKFLENSGFDLESEESKQYIDKITQNFLNDPEVKQLGEKIYTKLLENIGNSDNALDEILNIAEEINTLLENNFKGFDSSEIGKILLDNEIASNTLGIGVDRIYEILGNQQLVEILYNNKQINGIVGDYVNIEEFGIIIDNLENSIPQDTLIVIIDKFFRESDVKIEDMGNPENIKKFAEYLLKNEHVNKELISETAINLLDKKIGERENFDKIIDGFEGLDDIISDGLSNDDLFNLINGIWDKIDKNVIKSIFVDELGSGNFNLEKLGNIDYLISVIDKIVSSNKTDIKGILDELINSGILEGDGLGIPNLEITNNKIRSTMDIVYNFLEKGTDRQLTMVAHQLGIDKMFGQALPEILRIQGMKGILTDSLINNKGVIGNLVNGREDINGILKLASDVYEKMGVGERSVLLNTLYENGIFSKETGEGNNIKRLSDESIGYLTEMLFDTLETNNNQLMIDILESINPKLVTLLESNIMGRDAIDNAKSILNAIGEQKFKDILVSHGDELNLLMSNEIPEIKKQSILGKLGIDIFSQTNIEIRKSGIDERNLSGNDRFLYEISEGVQKSVSENSEKCKQLVNQGLKIKTMLENGTIQSMDSQEIKRFGRNTFDVVSDAINYSIDEICKDQGLSRTDARRQLANYLQLPEEGGGEGVDKRNFVMNNVLFSISWGVTTIFEGMDYTKSNAPLDYFMNRDNKRNFGETVLGEIK